MSPVPAAAAKLFQKDTRDDLQRARDLRAEAEAEKLMYPMGAGTADAYSLDLNMGEIRCPNDPAKLKQLIDLARKHASGDTYGEHNAIRQLVALKSAIKESVVLFHRPYHVDSTANPDRWISVEDFLKEKGCV